MIICTLGTSIICCRVADGVWVKSTLLYVWKLGLVCLFGFSLGNFGCCCAPYQKAVSKLSRPVHSGEIRTTESTNLLWQTWNNGPVTTSCASNNRLSTPHLGFKKSPSCSRPNLCAIQLRLRLMKLGVDQLGL